jgi:3',5'-cyclic AMP phosphodiesterase CpdA
MVVGKTRKARKARKTRKVGEWQQAGAHRLLILALAAVLAFAGIPFMAFAAPGSELPTADVLDVDFSARVAEDLSSVEHEITGGSENIIYDEALNKYVGDFDRSSVSAFKISLTDADYANLVDGLTLELVFNAQPVTDGYNNVVCNTQTAGFGVSLLTASSTSATLGTAEGYVRGYANGVSGSHNYISPRKDNGVTYGEWTHAALTYDGTAVCLYLNGQLVDSRSMSGPVVFPSGSARSLVIGGDITGSGGVEDPFLGRISTTRIYSEALSAEQISALAARDLAPLQKVAVEQVIVSTVSGQDAITTAAGTLVLKAELLPLAADNRFTWSIASGDEYATLSPQGVLVAKANGTVTVQATASDGSGVYGAKTIAISGQDGAGSEDGVVRFGVISDTHLTATKAVEQQRLAKAFQFFSGTGDSTIAPVDTMVVVGDLTDSGVQSEMDAWSAVKDANLTVPLIANMGNHENNRWAQFEEATGNKANDVKVVNGYYFITLSPGAGSLNTETGRATNSNTSNYGYAVSWLEEQLAIAEAASPDKPIFVFFHHPIRGTHYMSTPWPGYGLENVFKTHPRAVTFSGHLHSTNNLSTSIWQDGGYTTINTVTTSYMWLAAGMVYGEVPPNATQCAQGLLVEVDGSEVTVKNYDILADAWIDQTWNFDVDPASPRMPYTTANMNAAAVAPVFPDGATVQVSNNRLVGTQAVCDVSFDQAVIPGNTADTMGDIVYSYRYDFFNKRTGQVEESFQTYSEFYFLPRPETISYSLASQDIRLDANTNYELRIYAIDTFGNVSAEPLRTSFRSAGEGAYFTLDGPSAATENDTLDYTVSLGGVQNAGTVVADFSYEGELEFVEATSLDDALGVTYTLVSTGTNTVKVVLSALELPGLSLDGTAPIVKLSFKATGEGTGTVMLRGGEGGAYVLDAEGNFKDTEGIEIELPEGADASISTDIAKYFDPYDFNRDGRVSIADLTYAQAFYMVSAASGGDRWTHADERGIDVDANGVVDVADFILIIEYIYQV